MALGWRWDKPYDTWDASNVSDLSVQIRPSPHTITIILGALNVWFYLIIISTYTCISLTFYTAHSSFVFLSTFHFYHSLYQLLTLTGSSVFLIPSTVIRSTSRMICSHQTRNSQFYTRSHHFSFGACASLIMSPNRVGSCMLCQVWTGQWRFVWWQLPRVLSPFVGALTENELISYSSLVENLNLLLIERSHTVAGLFYHLTLDWKENTV